MPPTVSSKVITCNAGAAVTRLPLPHLQAPHSLPCAARLGSLTCLPDFVMLLSPFPFPSRTLTPH